MKKILSWLIIMSMMLQPAMNASAAGDEDQTGSENQLPQIQSVTVSEDNLAGREVKLTIKFSEALDLSWVDAVASAEDGTWEEEDTTLSFWGYTEGAADTVVLTADTPHKAAGKTFTKIESMVLTPAEGEEIRYYESDLEDIDVNLEVMSTTDWLAKKDYVGGAKAVDMGEEWTIGYEGGSLIETPADFHITTKNLRVLDTDDPFEFKIAGPVRTELFEYGDMEGDVQISLTGNGAVILREDNNVGEYLDTARGILSAETDGIKLSGFSAADNREEEWIWADGAWTREVPAITGIKAATGITPGEPAEMTVSFAEEQQIISVNATLSAKDGSCLFFSTSGLEETTKTIRLTADTEADAYGKIYDHLDELRVQTGESSYVYTAEELADFNVSVAMLSYTDYFESLLAEGQNAYEFEDIWCVSGVNGDITIPEGFTVTVPTLQLDGSEFASALTAEGTLSLQEIECTASEEQQIPELKTAKAGTITIAKNCEVSYALDDCLEAVSGVKDGQKLSGYSLAREREETYTWRDGTWQNPKPVITGIEAVKDSAMCVNENALIEAAGTDTNTTFEIRIKVKSSEFVPVKATAYYCESNYIYDNLPLTSAEISADGDEYTITLSALNGKAADLTLKKLTLVDADNNSYDYSFEADAVIARAPKLHTVSISEFLGTLEDGIVLVVDSFGLYDIYREDRILTIPDEITIEADRFTVSSTPVICNGNLVLHNNPGTGLIKVLSFGPDAQVKLYTSLTLAKPSAGNTIDYREWMAHCVPAEGYEDRTITVGSGYGEELYEGVYHWDEGEWLREDDIPSYKKMTEITEASPAYWPEAPSNYWFYFKAKDTGYYKFTFVMDEVVDYGEEIGVYKKAKDGKAKLVKKGNVYGTEIEGTFDEETGESDCIYEYKIPPVHIDEGETVYLKVTNTECGAGNISVAPWVSEQDFLEEVLNFDEADTKVTEKKDVATVTMTIPYKDADLMKYISKLTLHVFNDKMSDTSGETMEAEVTENGVIFTKEYHYSVYEPLIDYTHTYDHGYFSYLYKSDKAVAYEESTGYSADDRGEDPDFNWDYAEGDFWIDYREANYETRTEGIFALEEIGNLIFCDSLKYKIHYRMYLAGTIEEGRVYTQKGSTKYYYYKFTVGGDGAVCAFYTTQEENSKVSMTVFREDGRSEASTHSEFDSTQLRNFDVYLDAGTYYLKVTNEYEDDISFGFKIDNRDPVPYDITLGTSLISAGEYLPVTLKVRAPYEPAYVDIMLRDETGKTYEFKSVQTNSVTNLGASGDEYEWQWIGQIVYSDKDLPAGRTLTLKRITVTDKYGFRGWIDVDDPPENWYSMSGQLGIPIWFSEPSVSTGTVSASIKAKKDSFFYKIDTDSITVPENHTVTVKSFVSFTEECVIGTGARIHCEDFTCNGFDGSNRHQALLKVDGEVHCVHTYLSYVRLKDSTLALPVSTDDPDDPGDEPEEPVDDPTDPADDPENPDDPDEPEDPGEITEADTNGYIYIQANTGDYIYDISSIVNDRDYDYGAGSGHTGIALSVMETMEIRDIIRPDLDVAEDAHISLFVGCPYQQVFSWHHDKWMSNEQMEIEPSFEDVTVEYDGEPHGYTEMERALELPDGCAFEFFYRLLGEEEFAELTEETGITEPGIYEVRADITPYDGEDPIEPLYATLTITKGNQSIVWEKPDPDEILEVGKTYKAVVTADSESLTFESSDTSVLTVDQNGVITPVGPGRASIIVHAEADWIYTETEAAFTFRVRGSSVLRLVSATVEYDGKEHSLTVNESLLPEGASVKYFYNGEEASGVTEPGLYDVEAVFTVPEGTEPIETLTATLAISKGTQSITWKAPDLKDSLTAGKTYTIEAEAAGKLSYRSDDETVLTVSGDGKITAVSAGTAIVTVKAGETKYYKTEEKSFEITVGPAKNKISSLTNTASGVSVKYTKSKGADGYYLYRKNGSGKYSKVTTIKKAAAGTYLDKKAKTNGTKYTYKIVPYGIAYRTKTGEVLAPASAEVVTYYLSKPAKPAAKNNASKQAQVTWKKNAKATGYEVKYVTGKTTKTVKITKNSTLKTTLKSLKKGKTYKISVRSYKKVGSKTYYSAYSTAVSLKIKK